MLGRLYTSIYDRRRRRAVGRACSQGIRQRVNNESAGLGRTKQHCVYYKVGKYKNDNGATERPKREMERISFNPGILALACSIGNVTSLSTSGAANVGDTVITCT